MLTRFDHAVVVVDSLPKAVAAFGDAGFTVAAGGRHDALPTENALVPFADGAYLELLAFRDAGARAELRALRASAGWAAHLHGTSAIARRFLPRLAGPDGVADSVVTGERLARFANESRQREFVMTGPVAMRRERPGAEALAWELLLPAEDAIPFLIEDRTPRAWRVPASPEATRHHNGATGVAAVELGAGDPAAAALRLADLFGARLASRGGRTCVVFAGLEWRITPGDADGARGVRLAGVTALPAAIEALGVRGAA
jgi:hypothetical protein